MESNSLDEFLKSRNLEGIVLEEEAPAFTIKQMMYDLMDLCHYDGAHNANKEEYSENTMSFLSSIEKEVDKLGAQLDKVKSILQDGDHPDELGDTLRELLGVEVSY